MKRFLALVFLVAVGCEVDPRDPVRDRIIQQHGQEIVAKIWAETFGQTTPPPVVRFLPEDTCGYGALVLDGSCGSGIYNPEDNSAIVALGAAHEATGHELAHAWLLAIDVNAYVSYDCGHHLTWWWDAVRKADAAVVAEIDRRR